MGCGADDSQVGLPAKAHPVYGVVVPDSHRADVPGVPCNACVVTCQRRSTDVHCCCAHDITSLHLAAHLHQVCVSGAHWGRIVVHLTYLGSNDDDNHFFALSVLMRAMQSATAPDNHTRRMWQLCLSFATRSRKTCWRGTLRRMEAKDSGSMGADNHADVGEPAKKHSKHCLKEVGKKRSGLSPMARLCNVHIHTSTRFSGADSQTLAESYEPLSVEEKQYYEELGRLKPGQQNAINNILGQVHTVMHGASGRGGFWALGRKSSIAAHHDES